MTNPLLRPNDPRFRKPTVRDAGGKNVFAEGDAATAETSSGSDPYVAAHTDEARPFQPEYEAQQRPRGGLLLALASFGWAGAVLGAAALAGLFTGGWICPLLGIAPAAAAWLLGYEDLKAIDVGAMDTAERPRTRLAMWLGLAGLIACLGMVGSMIYRNMNFLPDLF